MLEKINIYSSTIIVHKLSFFFKHKFRILQRVQYYTVCKLYAQIILIEMFVASQCIKKLVIILLYFILCIKSSYIVQNCSHSSTFYII